MYRGLQTSDLMSKYLVTGTAGFIGFHLANALLARGEEVVGIDNINDYYDVNLKYARLEEAGIRMRRPTGFNRLRAVRWPGYRFVRMDIGDKEHLGKNCSGLRSSTM